MRFWFWDPLGACLIYQEKKYVMGYFQLFTIACLNDCKVEFLHLIMNWFNLVTTRKFNFIGDLKIRVCLPCFVWLCHYF